MKRAHLSLLTPRMLLIILVFTGIILRFWQYWEFPVVGETKDEVAWTMLGASLLQTGVPQSWSFFSGYTPTGTVNLGGTDYPLVAPALDHPPLFAFLPGSMQALTGESWQAYPSSKVIRFPMVVLASVSVVLFALLAWRELDKGAWSIAATFVFATAPSFVFLQRLVVSENLLLVCLLLLLLTFRMRRRWEMVVFFISLSLLPLIKISGLALSAAFFAWFLWRRSFVLAAAVAVSTLLGVGALLAYAATYDLDLFFTIQSLQASRDTGLLTFFSTQVWSGNLVQKMMSDTWILLGWGAALVSSIVWGQSKKKPFVSLLAFLFLSQLAFLLMSVGENTTHGWYRIVFLPLFALSLGWGFSYLWKTRSLFSLALLMLVLLTQLRLGLVSWLGTQFYPLSSAINKWFLLAAGVGVAVEALFDQKKWLPRFRTVVYHFFFLLLFAVHVITITQLSVETYWLDAAYLETGLRP